MALLSTLLATDAIGLRSSGSRLYLAVKLKTPDSRLELELREGELDDTELDDTELDASESGVCRASSLRFSTNRLRTGGEQTTSSLQPDLPPKFSVADVRGQGPGNDVTRHVSPMHVRNAIKCLTNSQPDPRNPATRVAPPR